jgi:hypothetical protein
MLCGRTLTVDGQHFVDSRTGLSLVRRIARTAPGAVVIHSKAFTAGTPTAPPDLRPLFGCALRDTVLS